MANRWLLWFQRLLLKERVRTVLNQDCTNSPFGWEKKPNPNEEIFPYLNCLPSYPEALRDFLPELKEHLGELSQLSQNPRQLAAHYCQTYEKRKQSIDSKWQPPTPQETVSRYQGSISSISKAEIGGEINSNTPETEVNAPNEEFLYLSLKADPHHLRLLQTKKVSQGLSDFIRRDYLESAIGKRFKFDRGMIIPSKSLKTGEIAVPWIKDGEPVLEFRAPFLNHNGMRQSINRSCGGYACP